MPVPETVKFTVWFPLTAAEAVTVTVITEADASDPAFELTEILTVGLEAEHPLPQILSTYSG